MPTKYLLTIALIIGLFACEIKPKEQEQEQEQEQYQSSRPNILFISVDDLRLELGCYGNEEIKSPNIDRLAAEGILFNRAYCQQPICMASRASILSGLRPDTLDIFRGLSVEEHAPNITTINRHFKNNGYQIWAAGKVYHHGRDRNDQFGEDYHQVKVNAVGRGYLSEASIKEVEEYDAYYRGWKNQAGGGRGLAFEITEVADNEYFDGQMTDMAIAQLDQYKDSEEPFFMAVGYKKPHLPFCAPKKYWDLYEGEELKKADNQYMPKDISQYFEYNFGELRNYSNIPKGNTPLSDSLEMKLKHGYYACVSYTDAQIGRLMAQLKETGLDQNTIVILWGDHGWKLGEHDMWCKHTPFVIDNHVPLMMRMPQQKDKGITTSALVELVDVFPTLCELSGLDMPSHLQGQSFASLLEDLIRIGKKRLIQCGP
ncbi:MAG: sulfatase [Bacteroidota bacterium]